MSLSRDLILNEEVDGVRHVDVSDCAAFDRHLEWDGVLNAEVGQVDAQGQGVSANIVWILTLDLYLATVRLAHDSDEVRRRQVLIVAQELYLKGLWPADVVARPIAKLICVQHAH